MPIVKLQILATDIIDSNYFDSGDCAITRALKRAKLDMREGAGEILHGAKSYSCFQLVMNTPPELENKVLGMYKYVNPQFSAIYPPIEPQDFEFELNLPDNYEK
jgi:hypothetical protein